jgi:hypothetical protein
MRPSVSGSNRHRAACARKYEERQAAAERTRRQQLQRVEQLIERAQKRCAAEDLTLREPIGSGGISARRSTLRRTRRETQQALVERLRETAASGAAGSTICARWTSGSGSPTPPSRKS